jgi:hypothetical protein
MPRTLPSPTPETRHFWEGCKAGEFAAAALRALRKELFSAAPLLPALHKPGGGNLCGQRQSDT